MAFATANVRTGTVGNLKFYAGDWSGAIGDATASVTLAGGRVYFCSFQNQDSSDTKEALDCPISISNGTITISVGNKQNVTLGQFFIVYS